MGPIQCPIVQSLCWIKFDMKLTCCLAFTFVITDFLVDKIHWPKINVTHLCIVFKCEWFILNWLDTHLCLVAEAAWSNANVRSLQLIEHTARQSLIVFRPHFSSEISFYTYLHTIYIKVYLTIHAIMMKFGALNWFDSFIKMLQESVGLYQLRYLRLCYQGLKLVSNLDVKLTLKIVIQWLCLEEERPSLLWMFLSVFIIMYLFLMYFLLYCETCVSLYVKACLKTNLYV